MIYSWFFRTVLRHIDSERAHRFAIRGLRAFGKVPGALALAERLLRPSPTLRVSALGLDFPTPLGVAAGVDKDATAFDALAALGFGAVEVGTTTNRKQEGNDGKRVWRLPKDRALLNWMGFPNDGARALGRRLADRRTRGVIGVNLGKSRVVPIDGEVVEDYRLATRAVAQFADYLALNVSSPNTPDLRGLQTAAHLEALVGGVREELERMGRRIPVLIKIAPDLRDEEVVAIAETAQRIAVEGIIAVNTTTDYGVAPSSREEIERYGDRGGVSGAPLKRRALEILSLLHDRADGLLLVSVGGIETAEDAWQRILAGATLVQAHTGFVYGGPLWPSRLNRGLARLLAESPYDSIADAVGKAPTGTSPKGARVDESTGPQLGARASIPASAP